MPADKTFIIVGAGLAGAKAAEGLRHEGFDGRLVLIGEEPDRPYERPPLSKDYLRKETADKPYVHPESYYDDQGIELMTSTRATELDTSAKKLVLDDERSIGSDRDLRPTTHYRSSTQLASQMRERVAQGVSRARFVLLAPEHLGERAPRKGSFRGSQHREERQFHSAL